MFFLKMNSKQEDFTPEAALLLGAMAIGAGYLAWEGYQNLNAKSHRDVQRPNRRQPLSSPSMRTYPSAGSANRRQRIENERKGTLSKYLTLWASWAWEVFKLFFCTTWSCSRTLIYFAWTSLKHSQRLCGPITGPAVVLIILTL